MILFEFLFFYKDKFSGILLCTLACAIHVLCVFTITIGSLAMIMGYPTHEILTKEKSFLFSFILSFVILDLITFGAIKFVPLPQVKLINQHQEQQWFIIAWMAVNYVFLRYVASALNNPQYPVQESGKQIDISIASLISLYIVLFFSYKTSSILGYKEKSQVLEQAIQQEQQYRNLMVKDAIASYEVNVTQDFIIKGFEEERRHVRYQQIIGGNW